MAAESPQCYAVSIDEALLRIPSPLMNIGTEPVLLESPLALCEQDMTVTDAQAAECVTAQVDTFARWKHSLLPQLKLPCTVTQPAIFSAPAMMQSRSNDAMDWVEPSAPMSASLISPGSPQTGANHTAQTPSELLEDYVYSLSHLPIDLLRHLNKMRETEDQVQSLCRSMKKRSKRLHSEIGQILSQSHAWTLEEVQAWYDCHLHFHQKELISIIKQQKKLRQQQEDQRLALQRQEQQRLEQLRLEQLRILQEPAASFQGEAALLSPIRTENGTVLTKQVSPTVIDVTRLSTENTSTSISFAVIPKQANEETGAPSTNRVSPVAEIKCEKETTLPEDSAPIHSPTVRPAPPKRVRQVPERIRTPSERLRQSSLFCRKSEEVQGSPSPAIVAATAPVKKTTFSNYSTNAIQADEETLEDLSQSKYTAGAHIFTEHMARLGSDAESIDATAEITSDSELLEPEQFQRDPLAKWLFWDTKMPFRDDRKLKVLRACKKQKQDYQTAFELADKKCQMGETALIHMNEHCLRLDALLMQWVQGEEGAPRLMKKSQKTLNVDEALSLEHLDQNAAIATSTVPMNDNCNVASPAPDSGRPPTPE